MTVYLSMRYCCYNNVYYSKSLRLEYAILCANVTGIQMFPSIQAGFYLAHLRIIVTKRVQFCLGQEFQGCLLIKGPRYIAGKSHAEIGGRHDDLIQWCMVCHSCRVKIMDKHTYTFVCLCILYNQPSQKQSCWLEGRYYRSCKDNCYERQLLPKYHMYLII